MKLIEKHSTFSKQNVYLKYQSIVYVFKNYKDITKNQMLKDIVKEYEQEDYLYYICTAKELKVLDKIVKNKLNEKDISKYEWEIKALADKLIIDEQALEVYEELSDSVTTALDKYHKEGGCNSENAIKTFVGLIRTYGAMYQDDFLDIACGITNLARNDLITLLGSPLFHFYCLPYVSDDEENKPIILYRDYSEYLELFLESDLDLTFRILLSFNYQYFESMFYYGFPINIRKVNKMYKKIREMDKTGYVLTTIEFVRIFGHPEMLASCFKDEDLLNLVADALTECPAPVYTKDDYEEAPEFEDDILNNSVFGDSRFPAQPDVDAHLSKDDSLLYDRIYCNLLEYTNKKYNLTNVKKVYKNKKIKVEDFYKIEHYFWDNLEVIDEFVKENIYNYKDFELELVEGFKKCIKDETLIIVGFTEDYIELLSEEDKLYMVKSPKPDFDLIFYDQNLPIKTDAKISEFKGNIVFNTFFKTNGYKDKKEIEEILERKKNAFKYYHL